MAADVAKFSAGIDKAFKTFSTQEVHISPSDVKGLNHRGAFQHMEKKFQQQLQRARAAFLQEFRNHSVVVESEVRKIREELIEKLDEKYGERIGALKAENAERVAFISKCKEEILQLKNLASVQETYLAAVRHRVGLESKERLRSEITTLREELDEVKQENHELGHQLLCRDELVAQLNNELSGLEGKIKHQMVNFAEERQVHEGELQALRWEVAQQQEIFQDHLRQYEKNFDDYKQRTEASLNIQEILNNRRSEALTAMEEERQLHIKARTKPSMRIGPAGEFEPEVEGKCFPYDLEKDSRYRVDDMGMDSSWRDYSLRGGPPAPPPKRKSQAPKFSVERLRKSSARKLSGVPTAPVPTDTPREERHAVETQMQVAALSCPVNAFSANGLSLETSPPTTA